MAATTEETSARGWSIRIPSRDVLMVVAALALGGGGVTAALRMLGAEPAKAAPAPDPTRSIADLAAEVAEVKRVQRIQARNELLLCDLAARIAKQPNPCVEPWR